MINLDKIGQESAGLCSVEQNRRTSLIDTNFLSTTVFAWHAQKDALSKFSSAAKTARNKLIKATVARELPGTVFHV